MKGRTTFNKAPHRNTEVFNQFVELGGEARWKDLKERMIKHGWGPTTLKQVLDEMVEEGTIYKEARLGTKGPEAWYVTHVKEAEYWETWKKMTQNIRDKLQQLKGEEKEVYLKQQMRKMMASFVELFEMTFYIFLIGAEEKKKPETLATFGYIFDTAFKKLCEDGFLLFLEHPQQAREAIEYMLKE